MLSCQPVEERRESRSISMGLTLQPGRDTYNFCSYIIIENWVTSAYKGVGTCSLQLGNQVLSFNSIIVKLYNTDNVLEEKRSLSISSPSK